MKNNIKLEFHKAIDSVIEKLADAGELENFWWTDDLVDNMLNAMEIVYNQNIETQRWLREQELLKDNL